jgi:hypothetical protein
MEAHGQRKRPAEGPIVDETSVYVPRISYLVRLSIVLYEHRAQQREPLKQLLWTVPAREMQMTWARLVNVAQALVHQG